jgi:FtsP/CotA-like multicopper oxidase with cupredoxin domain
MRLIDNAPISKRVNEIPASLIQFKNFLLRSATIWVLCGIHLHAQTPNPGADVTPQVLLPDSPEVRSPFLLQAITDPETGKSAFSFAGQMIPPVIRASPGQDIRLTYKNEMSRQSRERCVDGPCMNMTNLHFHGLHVSPDAPQDDVLTMMAMPGQSLSYVVNIPLDQPPGLYWYHTHPHGESYQQSLDGMSGAIVIDGMERYVPEVRNLRERILILRDRVVDKDDPAGSDIRHKVGIPEKDCSTSTTVPERVFTVNSVLRPAIDIAPGERQFWRIVNASPDLYADLKIDTETFEIIALDGMPLSFHDPKHRTELVDHIFVPPAGRVEAIVTGPNDGVHAALRTLCIDTGPDGDPNPAMALADLVDLPHPAVKTVPTPRNIQAPVYKPVSTTQIKSIENSSPDFVVTFTEDKNGFYINGKKFGMTDPPMVTVPTGTYRHWRVVNNTNELHPFHIHQVHFLIYSQNNERIPHPEWLDTVNVPVKGNVDLMMDFTDPIIRGVSLFHCHLLSHEDKGMMAKILFE